MVLVSSQRLSVASFLFMVINHAFATPFPSVLLQDHDTQNPLSARAIPLTVKTTTTKYHTIDWIPLSAQGIIAQVPGLLLAVKGGNNSAVSSELQEKTAILGPVGTVPIPRVDPTYLRNAHLKKLPSKTSIFKSKRQYSGAHWYVSGNQFVNNTGGSASYSLFKPWVNNTADFSLLQTAVTHNTANGLQTIEAGWINYPQQVAAPHLFTYFTTNGYKSHGNNIGGWNRDFQGWIQYDSQIFPGAVFSPTSVDGGAQYSVKIQYLLHQGNWWLWVYDRWIGYYPASMFSKAVSGVSLATGSDCILYYGEIFQTNGPMTNSDMGSGQYSAKGFGRSAYISNMVYTDMVGNIHDFVGGFWDSDPKRYDHVYVPTSGTNWGSYIYLGGPGAGGVLNG